MAFVCLTVLIVLAGGVQSATNSPEHITEPAAAIGWVLAGGLALVALAVLASLRFVRGDATTYPTARLGDPEVLSTTETVPSVVTEFPTYDLCYGGVTTEIAKRFELRQLSKTLERHLEVNQQSLRFVKQLGELEAGKTAIVNERFRQSLAPRECELRAEGMAAESLEQRVRIARADLDLARTRRELDQLNNPEPPQRPPTRRQRIRDVGLKEVDAGKLQLGLMRWLDVEEARELQKAPAHQQASIRRIFVKLREKYQDDEERLVERDRRHRAVVLQARQARLDDFFAEVSATLESDKSQLEKAVRIREIQAAFEIDEASLPLEARAILKAIEEAIDDE